MFDRLLDGVSIGWGGYFIDKPEIGVVSSVVLPPKDMKLALFDKYQELFLEAKAREWGWRGDDARIFFERMHSGNLGRSNQYLDQKVLKFVNAKGDPISNKVADTLSRNIMPKLKQAKGLLEQERWDWKGAQIWLQEDVFPLWVMPLTWQALWALTEPNPDIAVEIVKKPLVAGMEIPDDYEPYQIPIGANVRYQIPMAANEHLILLEKNGSGDIFCLQPSRYQKYKVGEPIATSELIAIVSPQKPAVDWWEAAASAKGFLPMQHQQLENLMTWTNNARNDCRLWQFEVEIVMPKIEAVATNI